MKNELSDQFRCADNSRCIPLTAYNDTFTDCMDGSDEPGKNGFHVSRVSQVLFIFYFNFLVGLSTYSTEGFR